MTPIESESLVETAKTANGILTKLIGPAAEEWGGIISDNLKPRRLKNQIRNLKKVQQIVQDEGLKLRNVNLKVLFPYLENVSLEEDESLQNMWANLFTNYLCKCNPNNYCLSQHSFAIIFR
ncbi:hypothetical protein ASE92_17275 [Pedobacter sp. Leaf41]|uniref:Abi-alpha family protein n=1 Tax=Pedobacter sp. Leaf41 TaxID=1736218 RepID=UPI0007037DD3|nr:hypothetical protein [Pedobacter sp. Leaf41]KQN32358.1 hypothetical protein ASE92_17275 [Pedobacter sp. Leaf41]